MQRTTTIIFDIGGVLITPSEKVTPFILSELTKAPLEQTLEVYEKAIASLRIGKLHLSTVIDRLRKAYVPGKTISDLTGEYGQFYRQQALVDEAMMDIVGTLARRYQLIAFTNMIDLHIQYNIERNLFRHFAKTYFSSMMGMAKPTKEAFLFLMNDLTVPPGECLFIDDKQENIDEALRIGMKTHVFVGTEELKGFLQKEGML